MFYYFIFFGLYIYYFLFNNLILFLKGPLKYRIINKLQNYIYFNPIGLKKVLQLDTNNKKTISNRQKGIEYLKNELIGNKNINTNLTDCRFKKIKVLFPLLKELELPIPNFIDNYTPNQKINLSNNAVHYFDNNFYDTLNQELFTKLNNNQYSFTSITPEIKKNSELICEMTNLDEVRYCLSGSEAVEVCFKDVKMSTGKKYIVRFKNSYHGHLTGVSFDAKDTIILNENDPESIEFIEKYHYKIAGVIVNPMQILFGPNNLSPPGEKITKGSRINQGYIKEDYSSWLYNLNQKCSYCTKYLSPIAFIIDDVYFGFRTKELFSFKYFSNQNQRIEPDLVILGKGVAGGFPLSIICGKKRFMNFYDRNYLLKVNRSVGTFSAWENGIIASNLFLEKVKKMGEEYDRINTKFINFTEETNAKFTENNLPIRIKCFSNVFTINYLNDSLYNSLYTQFLLAEDVYLSNQSTGKFIFSDEINVETLNVITDKLVKAGNKMNEYGFFIEKENKFWYLEFVKMFIFNFFYKQYEQIMYDKKIDIEVSHNHPFNKFGHFWSSIIMLSISYPSMISGDYVLAIKWFLFSHILRQSGHFFYERQDKNREKLKFGHKDGTKKFAAVGVFICVIIFIYKDSIKFVEEISYEDIALKSAFMTIIPHFMEICHKYGILRGIQWIIKIITDPVTDIMDFYQFAVIEPKYFVDWNI